MKAVATTLLLAAGFSNNADASRALRVSPELSPESHKKFFDKDYPDDLRPNVKSHFDHPFPIVQESHDYDADYVKDENKDNGEWLAQDTYDKLRTKLSNLKSDALAAKNKEDTAEEALKKAEDALKAAEEKAKGAEEALDASKKQADDSKEHLEEHAKHAGNGTSGSGSNETEGSDGADDDAAASNASAEVTKDEMTLEDCMKQLADAQGKLEKLHEEKAKREEEHQATLADEALAAEENANSSKHAAELAEQRRLAEEEHQKSLKSYDEEKAELEQMQKDLEKKAAILRKFREKAIGNSDGLYHDDHNGASKAAPLMIAALLAYCLI